LAQLINEQMQRRRVPKTRPFLAESMPIGTMREPLNDGVQQRRATLHPIRQTNGSQDRIPEYEGMARHMPLQTAHMPTRPATTVPSLGPRRGDLLASGPPHPMSSVRQSVSGHTYEPAYFNDIPPYTMRRSRGYTSAEYMPVHRQSSMTTARTAATAATAAPIAEPYAPSQAELIFQGSTTLEFPDTPVGRESLQNLRLCNPTSHVMKLRIRCEDTSHFAFECLANKVYIQPHSYVLVPIAFRPQIEGVYHGLVVVRTSGGGQRMEVRIQATAIPPNVLREGII
jgi:hypothetical protein